MRPLSLALAALVFCAAGCHTDPPPPPVVPRVDVPPEHRDVVIDRGEMYGHRIEPQAEEFTFLVRGNIAVTQSVDIARVDLYDQLRRDALTYVIKKTKSPAWFDQNRGRMEDLLSQSQNYIQETKLAREEVYDDGKRIGAQVVFVVDRARLARDVDRVGDTPVTTKNQMLLTIHGTAAVEADLLTDVGHRLSARFDEAGFEVRLWDDVRTEIAEDRNLQDVEVDSFMKRLVEDPKYAPEDKYQGTLTLLRRYGRLILAYNIYELRVDRGEVQVGIKVHLRDADRGTVVVSDQGSLARPVGSRTVTIAKTETVAELAAQLSDKMSKEATTWYLRLQERPTEAIELVFAGFTPEQEEQIERVLRNRMDRDVQVTPRDGAMVVSVNHPRSQLLDLRDSVERLLKSEGLTFTASRPSTEEARIQFTRKEK